MFTVKDIYVLGAALIGDHEGDDPDEELFAIPYMNILLQESLGCENSIRAAHGETELTAAPIVTSIEEELEYHDQLVRAAFPYGLVWQYHQEAGNHGLAAQYRNMFIDAVNGCYCYSMRKYR
jgi:hypothetical protein